jgi:hypothetical protein
MARPHPFDLVFGSLADERFPAIRDALGDDTGLDAFLLAQPAVDLLHDLLPDGGVGEAVGAFAAFVHAAYLFWTGGCQRRELDADAVKRLLAGHQATPDPRPTRPTSYIQIEPRRIWGRLADEETFEPLDGWFATRAGDRLDVVACFGVHPERPGLSVVAVGGPQPARAPARADGTAPFAPTMPGGDTAGLHEVGSPAELLLLAWRAAGRTGEA